MRRFPLQFPGLLCEDGNKFPPDPPALLLRIFDAFQLREKSLRRIHADHIEPQALAEHFECLHKFVLAQQTRVYKDVCQLVADCPVDKHRRHRRVHAAAQRANCTARPDFPPNRLDSLVNECRPAPRGRCPADLKQKIPQNVPAPFRVLHFGMELHCVDLALRVFRRRYGIFRAARRAESRRQRQHVVAMTAPDPQRFRQPREQGRARLRCAVLYLQSCRTVLPPLGLLHFSAELLRNPLHPVTNAQHGYAKLQHLRVTHGRARVVHRARPARQHHAHWLQLANLL